MRTYNDAGEWAGARMPPPGVPSAVAVRVAVPALQALLVALGVAGAFGAACWLLWYPTAIVPVALLTGSATFVGCLLRLLELERLERAPAGEPTPPAPAVTLVNARAPGEVTPRAQAAARIPERLQRFIMDCEGGTDRERLMRLGYSRAEIARYRSLLLRAECARWRTADPRGGWELTAPAAVILAENVK